MLNAMAESFLASLETELIDRSVWRTHDEARSAVFDYMEILSRYAGDPEACRIGEARDARGRVPPTQ